MAKTPATKYSDAIADSICERISDGESLRDICREKDMPNKATVFRWLAKNEVFRSQYTQAREEQADTIFDEILDIADDARNDWMAKEGRDGTTLYVVNGEAVARSRMRIDARKWMAGKLRPKKYGEKSQLEISGEDGGPVEIKTTISVVDANDRK